MNPLNVWALNANTSKRVKAMDFRFDVHVSIDSPDMTFKIFPKGGICKNLLGGDTHFDERFLVAFLFVTLYILQCFDVVGLVTGRASDL